MSMFAASTKIISRIQICVMLIAILGLFIADFTVGWMLTAFICYNIYSAAGISMMFHRYWTHKSFEFKYAWMKWPFTIIACLVGKGSPIAWVYVHRLHHTAADTAEDPHSPHFGGFRIMGFKSINLEKLKVFVIRDLLNKQQKFLNDYYLAIILLWASVLLLINPMAFYFMWVLPVAILQVSQDLFNFFAHTSGYRNQETKDKSTNTLWLWPLILGECWHNNHHASPKDSNFSRKWWEFDPTSALINLLKQ